MANCENQSNKWDRYRRKIKSGISNISRLTHYLEVYTQESRKKSSVIDISEEGEECLEVYNGLEKAKRDLRVTMFAIAEENAVDKRWEQLEEEDEDGLVELDEIMCSVCGLADEEDNDILICDRVGCCRAYHQRCQDPPEIELPSDEDWFCRRCQCLDDWYVFSYFLFQLLSYQ